MSKPPLGIDKPRIEQRGSRILLYWTVVGDSSNIAAYQVRCNLLVKVAAIVASNFIVCDGDSEFLVVDPLKHAFASVVIC